MTEKEFRTGELADGTRLMQSDKYINDALRTLSPSWHGEKVSKHHFVTAINDGIRAANYLDQIKKTLFYGRDNNLMSEGLRDVSELPADMDCGGANAANIIHAIIGKFTEAGELLEALRICYNGEGFDKVNGIEEVGDGFWYDAILLNECGGTFEAAQRTNIAKLRARFPDKFAAVNANERDLDAERVILENGGEVVFAGNSEPVVSKEFEPFEVDVQNDHLTGAEKVEIVESVPATGYKGVRAVEASADTAFAAIQNVGKSPTVETSDLNGELAKGPGERLHPLPGESFARTNNGKKV